MFVDVRKVAAPLHHQVQDRNIKGSYSINVFDYFVSSSENLDSVPCILDEEHQIIR